MDNKDIIVMLLIGLIVYLSYKLDEVSNEWEKAELGWQATLMHLRDHNVPIPTTQEYEKYVKEICGWTFKR